MATSSGSTPAPVVKPAEDLWSKALGHLKSSDQVFFQINDTDSNDRLKTLEEVLGLVKKSEDRCLNRRIKWKNRKGETVILRDVFEKMVVWIEKFKAIGDTIVQYDPAHAALPWAAARLVLQAAVNDIGTNGAMVEGMELVLNIIAKMGVVELLYLQEHLALQDQLRNALTELYSSVLEYLAEAHRYFNQKTVAKLARSVIQLEDITTKFTARIKSKLNEVESYVRLVSGQVLGDTYGKLGQVDGTLVDLATRIRKLDYMEARSDVAQGLMDEKIRDLRKTLLELNIPITRIATKLSSLNDKLKEKERLKIFEWLSMIPYTSHHRSKEKMLLPGSGAWLMQKPEFAEWMSSSTSSILWLHGIPGSGKSMLVARVIQFLQNRAPAEDGQASLAYFYCARTANEPERSDPVELMNSIVEQLSCCDVELPIRQPVVNAYLAKKKEARGRKPERLCLEDCVALIMELSDENPATIVIDGLDECDPRRRQDVLDALRKIITESDNVVKVFVSSRDDHDLVHRLSRTPNLYIEAADNMDDIEKFVTASVKEAIRNERILCGKVPWNLRTTIIEKLIREANGMFRLVSLHIESLCNPQRIKTKANVLDSLAHLPADLEVSYSEILTQIRQTQAPSPLLADRVLKWLLCAQEPLSSNVFLIAVCSDMADQDLLQHSDILSICCNLVVYDGETDRFRFAHLSVREHLEKLDDYSTACSNALAAEQCLSWFFTVGKFKTNWSHILEFDKSLTIESTPFCKEIEANDIRLSDLELFWRHADSNWGEYCRFAGRMREKGRLRTLLQDFLLFSVLSPQRQGLEFLAWVRRAQETYDDSWHDSDAYEPDLAYNSGFFYENLDTDPLFVACCFDLAEIAASLVNSNISWNLICGQAAAVWNATEALEVILNSLQGHCDPQGYLQLFVVEAISAKCTEALHLILGRAGRSFIQADNLCQIIRETDQRGKMLDFSTLQSLSQGNEEFRPNESVFQAAFACKTEGLTTLKSILDSTTTVELTIKLVLSALFNGDFTEQIIEEVLRFGGAVYITPQVLLFIADHCNSFWASLIVQRWERLTADMKNSVESDVHRRMCTISEYIGNRQRERIAAGLPLYHNFPPDVWALLMQGIVQPLKISWKDLHMLQSTNTAGDYLVLLLQSDARMNEAALSSLVASWDACTMKRVLQIQDVKISNRLIRAAATNIKEGKGIMEVLLEHEALTMDSMGSTDAH